MNTAPGGPSFGKGAVPRAETTLGPGVRDVPASAGGKNQPPFDSAAYIQGSNPLLCMHGEPRLHELPDDSWTWEHW